jgi:outer membrane protein TolC
MQSYYESELRRMSDSTKTERYVALRRVQESEQTLALFERKALPLARQRVDIQRSAFIASSSPLVMLLEAERALRSVELEYESARATHERRIAELERAEGRLPGLGNEREPQAP